ncbi:phospholipase D Active site motif protein [Aspergillus luchuensis]|uniref:Phospholipase D Active site motif protein n=1 Tax=Aspergillus kawachii TaxID=1069201 RepID=A0A146FFH7_ASPKA|nr:phospholipase D Active site motif protein [Aspergillus luchuensis]
MTKFLTWPKIQPPDMCRKLIFSGGQLGLLHQDPHSHQLNAAEHEGSQMICQSSGVPDDRLAKNLTMRSPSIPGSGVLVITAVISTGKTATGTITPTHGSRDPYYPAACHIPLNSADIVATVAISILCGYM